MMRMAATRVPATRVAATAPVPTPAEAVGRGVSTSEGAAGMSPAETWRVSSAESA
jgi:hypothetical protein